MTLITIQKSVYDTVGLITYYIAVIRVVYTYCVSIEILLSSAVLGRLLNSRENKWQVKLN